MPVRTALREIERSDGTFKLPGREEMCNFIIRMAVGAADLLINIDHIVSAHGS